MPLFTSAEWHLGQARGRVGPEAEALRRYLIEACLSRSWRAWASALLDRDNISGAGYRTYQLLELARLASVFLDSAGEAHAA